MTTSIVDQKSIIEPESLKINTMIKVKWGKKVLTAKLVGKGSRTEMEKKEATFCKGSDVKPEALKEDKTETPPLKKKKTECQKKLTKRNKDFKVLRITSPQKSQHRPEETCILGEEDARDNVTLDTKLPTCTTCATDIPILKLTLENTASFFSEQMVILQVANDTQANVISQLKDQILQQEARICQIEEGLKVLKNKEVEGSMSKYVTTVRPSPQVPQDKIMDTSQTIAKPCLDIEPKLLKSPEEVIEDNIGLLNTSAKAGRLAVRLAKDAYFGTDMMKTNTISSLPTPQKKKIKEKVFKAYNFTNPLEFEPIWQKCVIAIGKACQALRAEKYNIQTENCCITTIYIQYNL